MKLRFLLILPAVLVLAGCSAAGFQGQTTVIVVTATPPPAGQSAQATATPPVVQNAPTQGAGAAAPVPTNTVPSQANPTPNALMPATGAMPPVSVKRLLDYTLVDPNGSPLGKLKDLVISRGANAPTGQIPYLVVESSQREDWLIPVPWQKAQLRPDLQAVVLPVTAAQLMNAPGFNKDLWPGSFAAQQAALQNYWANPAAAAPPTTGIAQSSELQASDYIRGDDVLSIDFINQQGQKLGEIKDIAIDWQNSQPGSAQSGQFGYVILELDDTISTNNVMVPVPWRFVNLQPGQKDMLVNFTPALLQTAPTFAKGLMPNLYSEPLQSQLNTFWSGK